MKRFSSYVSIVLAFMVIAISTVSPLSTASAAEAKSSSISITPRKNYLIKPGDTAKDKLQIGNLDKTNDLSVSLRMIDFTFTDQTGTPKLAIAQNAPQTPWSLKPFTKFATKTVIIPAGQTKSIDYTITMPKNQGAGSYYSAIMYQAGGANGGNVALNASGVTLAFVSVPGTVNEKMTLQKFGAYNSTDSGATGSYVFIAMNGTPKMMAYTLKNEGNVFESPAGNIIIKNMFGKQVANVVTNTNSSLALLGQTRLFASCIRTVAQDVQVLGGTTKSRNCVDPKLWPGRYTAQLNVLYGQNGNETHEIAKNAVFWVLPWWFIVLVLILLAAAVFGGWWLWRKIQRVVHGTGYRAGKGVRK